MANILGLTLCTHDSSAAIIKGRELVAAVAEERLNRLKHYPHFPELSIAYCLNEAKLTTQDIEHVVIPFHPTCHLAERLKFLFCFKGPANLIRRARFIKYLTQISLIEKERARKMFPKARIHFIEHHMAHAASAYFASPFSDAAILTIDGKGEWSTMLLAGGQENRISKIEEMLYPYSLGLVYLAFTHYLGFNTMDEYKVMGLAPYGSPVYIDFFRKALKFSKKAIVDVDLDIMRHPGYSPGEWNRDYFSQKTVSYFGPPRKYGEPVEQRHMDIAASLQLRFNEIGIEIARRIYLLTRKKYLCMAGGVALNGVMNWKIKNEGIFKEIFVQPAAGDDGLAVGSALYLHSKLHNRRELLFKNPYLGPEFSDTQIQKELDTARLEYCKLKDPAYAAATLLKDGYIIGWFQSRSELGPRALGNRSILADPRKAENKDIVNARIKFREEFRPFAPSILEEHIDDYYINGNGYASKYMLLVVPVKPGKEKTIPAVTHIDGTGRVQTVNKQDNLLYYSLLRYFYELTGVPVVLNTSFNVKGEPIVNSPVDAIRCFFSTGLDFLIMGDFLLFKKPIPDNIKKMMTA